MIKIGQTLGNASKLYGDTYLSAVGLGNVISDKAYKGDNADRWAKASQITGGIAKTAAPLVANAIAPGSGAIVSGGQQALGVTLNKPIKGLEQPKPETQTIPQPSYMKEKGATSYRAYKLGGEVDDEDDEETLINVEKGELEVDPNTCEIIQEFNDVPKHPKGKDIVDLKGNVMVKKTSIIIPANMRGKYMSSDKGARLIIIQEVNKNAEKSENGKAAKGGKTSAMDYGAKNPTTSKSSDNPLNELAFNPNIEQDSNVEDLTRRQGIPEATRSASLGDYAPNYLDPLARQEAGPTASDNETSNTLGDYTGLVGGATAVPKLIYGLSQTQRAKTALGDLAKKPMPGYAVTKEQEDARKRAGQSYDRAQGLAKTGFTPQEQAAYQQHLAKANSTTLYNARNQAGGQLGGAVNASLGSQNINALLDFAAKDAALNRQNISYADRMGAYLDSTGTAISGQKNLQNNLDVNRRLIQEQTLGKALSQGRGNTTDAASQLAGNATLQAAQYFK